jgi:hypothetical protein
MWISLNCVVKFVKIAFPGANFDNQFLSFPLNSVAPIDNLMVKLPVKMFFIYLHISRPTPTTTTIFPLTRYVLCTNNSPCLLNNLLAKIVTNDR